MAIIDFKLTPKEALANGMAKGLGAPFLLYGNFELPDLDDPPGLNLRHISSLEALSGDWERIGSDIGTAIGRYEQESPDPEAKTANG